VKIKALISILICLFSCWGMQEARGDISDTIAGMRSSGSYSWKYGYHLQLSRQQVLIRVGIHLIPAPGVNRMQLSRMEPAWKKGIEQVWSDRFALVSGKERYPIRIEAKFSGLSLQHDVIVLPGGGRRSNELTWHVMDTPQTAAHEFGHMLGLYDEYKGGACNPLDTINDPGSIMTSAPIDGKSRQRHYEQFRQWFIEKTGRHDVILQPLVE